MKQSLSIITILIVLCSGTLAALAAFPRTINYQGYLKDSSGAPVNSTIGMTFRMYSSVSGLNPIWNSGTISITPEHGLYSVEFGANPQPALPSFARPYWLGVTVGAEQEMRPLQPILAVPYAINSGCNPGDYMGCYTGAPGTMNVGLCKDGIRTCLPDGSGYGPCVGEIIPVQEICYNNEDEDCDGQMNTGCPTICEPGSTTACYSGPPGTVGIGICKSGIRTCAPDGYSYGPCIGETLPSVEACDGLDNNCDGSADNAPDICLPGMLCMGAAGCISLEGSPCDDGDPCTINDTYHSGFCTGVPLSCDDGSACTIDSCNPATGACMNTPITCDDGNACTADSCNPLNGCEHINLTGTPCGSGLTCQSGVCI